MDQAAADRWREQLARWAIPDEILRRAPSSPYGFSVDMFVERAELALSSPPTPTHDTARAALPAGGTVLDIGCGGGAASLPLAIDGDTASDRSVSNASRAVRAGALIGVDEGAQMLEAYRVACQRLGVPVRVVEGRWPDVAPATPDADVVVCANVAYNVADLTPFVHALTAHARRRVVLELPTVHPLSWMSPYWRDVHGLTRPDGPTADDAAAVVAGTGVSVERRTWRQPSRGAIASVDDTVAFLRQRLCLDESDDDRLRALFARHGVPEHREVVALWWDTHT